MQNAGVSVILIGGLFLAGVGFIILGNRRVKKSVDSRGGRMSGRLVATLGKFMVFGAISSTCLLSLAFGLQGITQSPETIQNLIPTHVVGPLATQFATFEPTSAAETSVPVEEATPTPAVTASPVSQQTEFLAFSDDFHQRGFWREISQGQFSSSYDLDTEEYVAALNDAQSMIALSPYGSPLGEDVRVSAEFRTASSGAGQYGVTCRELDQDNYYYGAVSTSEKDGTMAAVVGVVQDGKNTLLQRVPFTPAKSDSNGRLQIMLDCQGTQLTMFIDGQPFIITDDARLGHGQSGLLFAYGRNMSVRVNRFDVIHMPKKSSSVIPAEGDPVAQAIRSAQASPRDPYDIAHRFGKPGADLPDTTTGTVYQEGDQRTFWVQNINSHEQKRITAELLYQNDVAYFWVQDGLLLDFEAVKKLLDTFAEKIYPTDRAFFGSEPNPGIDNDPRLHILVSSDVGSVGGYFSSADDLPQSVSPHSNEAEMFILGSSVDPASPFAYMVLAHEFQHMIKSNTDANEDAWVNEGFSELAAALNGHGDNGHIQAFLAQPGIQLNTWTDGNFYPHYGSSYLFLSYLLNRLGVPTMQDIYHNQRNGLDSIEETLVTNGWDVSVEQLFADWAVTNLLNRPDVDRGQYGYYDVDLPSTVAPVDWVGCPTEYLGEATQFGALYLRISCPSDQTLVFDGNNTVRVVPASDMLDGGFMWSNRGDNINTYMTRVFDFTNVAAPIQMSYSFWHDIEQDYDYAYLSASTDGETWEFLATSNMSQENLSGNNLGIGYTGARSAKEEVDLSKYAGKKVTLRVDYITDDAVDGNGLALDNLAVPQAEYLCDFEQDTCGWDLHGFVRVPHSLRQKYAVTLVEEGSTPLIETKLLSQEQAQFELRAGKTYVLVVSGVTRYTTQRSEFQLLVK